MDFFSMLLNKVMGSSDSGDSSNEIDFSTYITNAANIFNSAKSFPNKAVVNLHNAISVSGAFGYWKTSPIPIVEELTVNAPNINVSSVDTCMGKMFSNNYGVKKVVLNMPNESQYMNETFISAINLEEVVLSFLTKNIKNYSKTFMSCSALKRIVGVLDFSSSESVLKMFTGCTQLEEVVFEPNTLLLSIDFTSSSKLTSESIQSIIDGLATVETAQTLTLNSNVLSNVTDEQWLIAEEKNWTIS